MNIKRFVRAAVLLPFICAWSPPVPMLDGRIRMFFDDDLRDTHLTPKIVAASCVRHRSGQVHYEVGRDNAFYIICRIPKLPDVSAHTIRFHFMVAARKDAGGGFINVLTRIELLRSQFRTWNAFNASDKNTLVRSIRDLALDDGSIPDIPEGQDAFGDWRWCQSSDDTNCFPKPSY